MKRLIYLMIIIGLMIFQIACASKESLQPEAIEEVISEPVQVVEEEVVDEEVETSPAVVSPAMHGMVIDDSYIYHSYMGIHKISLDGSTKVRIVDDYAHQLYHSDNWLFYINISDNHQIYRVDKDGQSKKKMSEQSVRELIVADDYIYAIDDENDIIRGDLKGTFISKVAMGDFDYLNYYEGSLYAISGGNAYIHEFVCIDPKSGVIDWLKSFNQNRVYNLILTKDYAFVQVDAEVHRMTHDGGDYTLITKEGVQLFSIYGDYVYYVTGGNLELYRKRIDGSESKALQVDKAGKIYHLSTMYDHLYLGDYYVPLEQLETGNFTLYELKDLTDESSAKQSQPGSNDMKSLLYKIVNSYNGTEFWEGQYDLDSDGIPENITLEAGGSYGDDWVCTVSSSTQYHEFQWANFYAFYLTDLNSDGVNEIIYENEYRGFVGFELYAYVNNTFERVGSVFESIENIENDLIKSGLNAYRFNGEHLVDQYGNVQKP